MNSPVDVKVHYGNGMFLTLKGNSFKKAMFIAWGGVLTERHEPVKIELLSTSKILYANKEAFMAFLSDKITLNELITTTQCDDVYRNLVEIIHQGETIEPGQLWIKRQNHILLINDDDYIEIPFEEQYFEIVK